MHVQQAIENRRAYTVLDPIEISEETIRDLAKHASLAPSCYNKQPWRFVFITDNAKLKELHNAYMKGNEWCHDASMMTAVCTRKENDCVLHDNDVHPERAYFQFDTGLGVGSMLLRAAELDLVAHPIAGYFPDKVRAILGVPDDYQVLAMIAFGKHAEAGRDDETDKKLDAETERPQRLPFEAFASIDTFDIKEP